MAPIWGSGHRTPAAPRLPHPHCADGPLPGLAQLWLRGEQGLCFPGHPLPLLCPHTSCPASDPELLPRQQQTHSDLYQLGKTDQRLQENCNADFEVAPSTRLIPAYDALGNFCDTEKAQKRRSWAFAENADRIITVAESLTGLICPLPTPRLGPALSGALTPGATLRGFSLKTEQPEPSSRPASRARRGNVLLVSTQSQASLWSRVDGAAALSLQPRDSPASTAPAPPPALCQGERMSTLQDTGFWSSRGGSECFYLCGCCQAVSLVRTNHQCQPSSTTSSGDLPAHATGWSDSHQHSWAHHSAHNCSHVSVFNALEWNFGVINRYSLIKKKKKRFPKWLNHFTLSMTSDGSCCSTQSSSI